jgi:hypothetical protein
MPINNGSQGTSIPNDNAQSYTTERSYHPNLRHFRDSQMVGKIHSLIAPTSHILNEEGKTTLFSTE